MNQNLYERFARSIADPQKIAIETLTGEQFSYADVMSWSARLAGALAGLGVRPGDRVAVQVEKSVPALMLYLATVRAGGVFLPLNTAYTPTEVAYFLTDAEPAVFVCDPARRTSLEPIAERVRARVVTLDARGEGTLIAAAAEQPDDFQSVERNGSDLAAILYTSGTTGRSKGAMLSHHNLVSNAET